MKLKGKVAVITGGNSGIGLATAKDFKAQGARVVIFGRSQRALDVANQTIGNGTLAVQGDVMQLPDLDRLYQQTVERFGKFDILMVNAGIAKPPLSNRWMRRCSTKHQIPISRVPSLPYNGPFLISTTARRSFS